MISEMESSKLTLQS